jgi:hypothetical protein
MAVRRDKTAAATRFKANRTSAPIFDLQVHGCVVWLGQNICVRHVARTCRGNNLALIQLGYNQAFTNLFS